RPDGSVSILPAILAQSRRIALDASGIGGRLVEGRREKQGNAVVAADKIFVDRIHGAGGSRPVGGLRHHRPRLSEGIDAAFDVGNRSEGATVTVIAAAIPIAVPGLALQ